MNAQYCSRLLLRIASVTAISLLAATAYGAGTDEAIFACRQLEEPGRRLSCYDRIGREDAKAAGEEAAASAPAKIEPETIRQKVVAVSRAPDGRLAITLDNAQTWRQVDTDHTDIRPGDFVTIRSAALGSWLLVGERNRNSIRVRWQR